MTCASTLNGFGVIATHKALGVEKQNSNLCKWFKIDPKSRDPKLREIIFAYSTLSYRLVIESRRWLAILSLEILVYATFAHIM